MKLTSEQTKILEDFLNAKSTHAGICPICNNKTVSIEPVIYEVRELSNEKGDIVLGAEQSVKPVIPITCTNCGHTTFINAIMSGVLKVQK